MILSTCRGLKGFNGRPFSLPFIFIDFIGLDRNVIYLKLSSADPPMIAKSEHGTSIVSTRPAYLVVHKFLEFSVLFVVPLLWRCAEQVLRRSCVDWEFNGLCLAKLIHPLPEDTHRSCYALSRDRDQANFDVDALCYRRSPTTTFVRSRQQAAREDFWHRRSSGQESDIQSRRKAHHSSWIGTIVFKKAGRCCKRK